MKNGLNTLKKREYKMKKTLFTLASVLMIFALAACGSKADTEPDFDKTEKALLTEIEYTDELNAIDEDLVSILYTDLDLSDVTKYKVYVSSGATSEELALFLCKDLDAAKRVMSAAQVRVNDQMESYKSYMPDEAKRLENMRIIRRGNLVCLTVSSYPEKASEIFNR